MIIFFITKKWLIIIYYKFNKKDRVKKNFRSSKCFNLINYLMKEWMKLNSIIIVVIFFKMSAD